MEMKPAKNVMFDDLMETERRIFKGNFFKRLIESVINKLKKI